MESFASSLSSSLENAVILDTERAATLTGRYFIYGNCDLFSGWCLDLYARYESIEIQIAEGSAWQLPVFLHISHVRSLVGLSAGQAGEEILGNCNIKFVRD